MMKQQSYNGSSYTDVSSAIDTYETYKIVCQEFPFKYLPESKDLAKRDWYDEDGEDVYVPTDGLKMKAYDLEVKFMYSGSKSDMHDKLRTFIDFLYGKNSGGAPFLAVYDEYTGIGLRGLYVSEVPNDLYDYSDIGDNGIAIFKVKFRVTDPVTRLNNQLNEI